MECTKFDFELACHPIIPTGILIINSEITVFARQWRQISRLVVRFVYSLIHNLNKDNLHIAVIVA